MLSKYQALLPLLGGLLLSLVWTGRLRERRHLAGVVLASVVLLALFAPHAAWVVRHDFTTLRYAATSVDAGGATTSHALRAVLSFAANQLRMLSMLLLAAALYAGWRRLRPAQRPPPPEVAPAAFADRDASRWLAGLLWAPALLLVATAVAGVSLRNHWGVQMFQFASLWIAWRWRRTAAIDLRRLAWIVLALHAVLLAAYALQQRAVRPPDDGGRRLDTLYPAAGLARAMTAQWRTAVGPACPLRYVSGNVYLAGLAALHAGEGAVVTKARRRRPGSIRRASNAPAASPSSRRSATFLPGRHGCRPTRSARCASRRPDGPSSSPYCRRRCPAAERRTAADAQACPTHLAGLGRQP